MSENTEGAKGTAASEVEVKRLQDRVESQDKTIKHLKEKLKNATSSSEKKAKIVSDKDGNKFQLKRDSFGYKKSTITFDQLSENKELVSELVELGCGYLIAV